VSTPDLLAGALGDGPAPERLARFLASHWQRAPLLLPDALAGFEVPLDADELAGLACEPDADARLVRTTPEGFELETGPFDAARFDALGDRDWTLLVNAVDLALPGFEPLLEAARFVPDWRLDDVMVSFAAPGGSVGPHADRYDVFLLQAEGTRRWDLGRDRTGDGLPVTDAGGLRLVTGFSPHVTHRCAPGDGLYLPPGVVHHGVAETSCLTISLGFRAPSLPELVADWALALADDLDDGPVDLDPPLPADPARLDTATVARARALLRETLERALAADDDAFGSWLGELLSRGGRNARFEVDAPLGPEGLRRELGAGAVLERAPGLRLLLQPAGTGTRVHAGGETVESDAPPDALACFTHLGPVTLADLDDPRRLALAAALVDAGRYVLVDPDGA
jgi:50S ribosomal protein L16 3-hydroxylase